MYIHRLLKGIALVILAPAGMACALVNYAVFGSGASSNANKQTAGNNAARAARDSLYGATPRLVVVLNSVDNQASAIAGVREIFSNAADTAIILGITGKNLFTKDGRGASVVVWAIGGDAGIVKAIDSVTDTSENSPRHWTSGQNLANQLGNTVIPAGRSRVVLLFGGCNYPRDSLVVGGIASVMGGTVPLAGMSSTLWPPAGGIYVSGRVTAYTNVAVLLWGSFKTGFGMVRTGHASGSITAADASVAAQSAAGEIDGTVKLMLAFDCDGRYGNMDAGTLTQELTNIKNAAGSQAAVCGAYAWGEIGKSGASAAPMGKNLSISCLAFAPDSSNTSVADSRCSWQDNEARFSIRGSAAQGSNGYLLIRVNGSAAAVPGFEDGRSTMAMGMLLVRFVDDGKKTFCARRVPCPAVR